MIPSVTLVLHDADSIRVLHRALSGLVLTYQTLGDQALATGARELKAKRASESLRHERRSAEYVRRAGLVQQLLDQLPTEEKPIPAPMGEQ